MKWLLFISLAFVSCQSSNQWPIHSLAEAKAFAKLSVEYGAMPKSQAPEMISQTSRGKPLEGTWDKQKMERHVINWVNAHPRAAELNRAVSKGFISERDRLMLITQIEATEAQKMSARSAAMSAASTRMANNASNSATQSSLDRLNSTLQQQSTEIRRMNTNMMINNINPPRPSRYIY
jgi:hypothetical protein